MTALGVHSSLASHSSWTSRDAGLYLVTRNPRRRGVVFGHCLAPARRVRLVVHKKIVFLCTVWAPNNHKSFLGCRENGDASLIKDLKETEQAKRMYAPQLAQSRRRLTPRVGNARTESEVARIFELPSL